MEVAHKHFHSQNPFGGSEKQSFFQKYSLLYPEAVKSEMIVRFHVFYTLLHIYMFDIMIVLF